MSGRSKTDKIRMSIYVTEANRRRLARIPRGRKTEIVNEALEQVLMAMEQRAGFQRFLKKAKAIQPVKAAKSSQELVRDLRDTGAVRSAR